MADHHHIVQAVSDPLSQIGSGAVLVTMPLWLQYFTTGAQVVAVVTGAILGCVGVYRLFRNKRGDQ